MMHGKSNIKFASVYFPNPIMITFKTTKRIKPYYIEVHLLLL